MIPRIIYPNERTIATALIVHPTGERVIPKDESYYPVWRIIDHNGNFVQGGVGSYNDKNNMYQAEVYIPEFADISASYSNPSVDTSNQAQRPYMIEWEMIDIQGKEWNFRETFEVGNPNFTTEVKENEKFTISMASLPMSIPLVRDVSFDSTLLFQVFNTSNKLVYEEIPRPNGSYGEYYIYSIEIPSNTLKEGEYLGIWQFRDCPIGGNIYGHNNVDKNNTSCTTFVDTTSGKNTSNYPVKTTGSTVFSQVIHVGGTWELMMISHLRMYLDKVAKNLDIYTGYRDSDLVFHLKMGAEYLNTFGLLTNWTIDQWKNMQVLKQSQYWLLQAAMYSCLRAQYLAEGDSTFDFSGQPVSLSIDRTSFISEEIGRIQDGLTSQFVPYKNQLVKSMKSVGHLNLQYPTVCPNFGYVSRGSLGFPFPLFYQSYINH